jgi:tellurite methyltransferase
VTDDRGRWNERYLGAEVGQPSSFLVGLDHLLPRTGRALDVAGGSGRHALWLATRGLDVTLVDVADVGLELAAAEARRRDLTLEVHQRDLESQGLPPGKWDMIVCFHYLHRPLFGSFPAALAPAGLLVCEIATVRNLERHDRPPRPYLLEEGELAALAGDLETVSYDEGWVDDHRHCARLVARRSVPADGDDG